MDGLRLLLLLVGVLVVAGLYFWGTRLKRQRVHAAIDRRSRRRPVATTPHRVSAKFEDDVDVAEALADLPTLSANDDRPESPPAARAPARKPRARGPRTAQATLDFGETAPAPAGLLTLGVRALPGQFFAGPVLREALEALGLVFGDMQVFDHHGVGRSKSTRPVFSAANMFEPGTFDPARMEDFSTRGVVLYLPLPAPIDGKVAAELMLSTGQRLAERLGGELLNERREPLSPADIEALRKEAARHGPAAGR